MTNTSDNTESGAGPTSGRRRGLRGIIGRNLRWQLPPILLIGAAIAWIDRANLGVAAPDVQADLGLSATEMGMVLGSYALALAIVHPIWGYAVDKIGSPRWLYFGSTMAWFVFTTLTAFSRGIVSLFTFRFLLAAGEAPQASSALKATSRWFPRRERALAIGTYEVGSEFGGAIAVPLVAFLVAAIGWRGSFVATGLLGLAFGIVWLVFYRDPEKRKRITAEELAYIKQDDQTQGDEADATRNRPARRDTGVRWIDLFRYRSVWGLLGVMFCRTSVIFFFITWYPSYLVDARGFTLLELGLFGALPGLFAIVGDLAGGWFSDHLVRRGTSPTLARKLPIAIGLVFGMSIALTPIADSAAGALALLSISSAGVAFSTGALYAIPLEIAPHSSNAVSISGLMRSGGLIGGSVMPIVVGAVFDRTGSFTVPLVLTGLLLAVGIALLFLVVDKVEPLPLRGKPVAASEE